MIFFSFDFKETDIKRSKKFLWNKAAKASKVAALAFGISKFKPKGNKIRNHVAAVEGIYLAEFIVKRFCALEKICRRVFSFFLERRKTFKNFVSEGFFVVNFGRVNKEKFSCGFCANNGKVLVHKAKALFSLFRKTFNRKGFVELSFFT